jgi:hypothetical protein
VGHVGVVLHTGKCFSDLEAEWQHPPPELSATFIWHCASACHKHVKLQLSAFLSQMIEEKFRMKYQHSLIAYRPDWSAVKYNCCLDLDLAIFDWSGVLDLDISKDAIQLHEVDGLYEAYIFLIHCSGSA